MAEPHAEEDSGDELAALLEAELAAGTDEEDAGDAEIARQVRWAAGAVAAAAALGGVAA